jgi:hypothetical protein
MLSSLLLLATHTRLKAHYLALTGLEERLAFQFLPIGYTHTPAGSPLGLLLAEFSNMFFSPLLLAASYLAPIGHVELHVRPEDAGLAGGTVVVHHALPHACRSATNSDPLKGSTYAKDVLIFI